MDLPKLRDALLTVTTSVHHYDAPKGTTGNHIVWAEDGQAGETHGNNRMVAHGITGTVDYYTTIEFDPAVKAIQKAMSDAGIPWRLNSVQREEEGQKYIHHEWVWTILVDPHG